MLVRFVFLWFGFFLFGLVCFSFVWSGMVWFVFLWFGLFLSGLFCFLWFSFIRLGLVCFGLFCFVVFGLVWLIKKGHLLPVVCYDVQLAALNDVHLLPHVPLPAHVVSRREHLPSVQ